MKFLIDANLPPALAAYLKRRGHDCVHVSTMAAKDSSDKTIWTLARRQARVVVSKDEDFFHLANRAMDRGILIWVRLGNCATSRLLATVGSHLGEIESRIESGERVIELRDD